MIQRSASMLVAVIATLLGLACGTSSPAAAHFERGLELAGEGRWRQAVSEFDEVIRLDSQYADAYHNRDIAYAKLDQARRAIEDYDEALRLDPQHANAYAGRALAYTLLNKDTEAQQDVDRVVALGIDAAFLKRTIEDLKKQR